MHDGGRGPAAGGVPSWVGDRQRGSRCDFMSPLAVTADCDVGDITHCAHRHADISQSVWTPCVDSTANCRSLRGN